MNKKCKKCEQHKNNPRILRIHWGTIHRNSYKNYETFYGDYIQLARGITEENIKNIVEEYSLGVSRPDLQKKWGFDVTEILKSKSIKIRTISDSRKTENYKTKHRNTTLKNWGVENISQSDVVKEKKKKTFIKHFGYKNNFCNEEILRKAKIIQRENFTQNREEIIKRQKDGMIKNWGVDNVSKHPIISKKISETHKILNANKTIEEKRKQTFACRNALLQTQYTARSNLERRIEEIIKILSYKIKFNKIVCRKNVDILLTEIKVIIEIQGTYFHADPRKYKPTDYFKQFNCTAGDIWKKDNNKKILFENNGYKVYHLWEKEINEMSDGQIIEFIIKIYNENSYGKNNIN
jgi:very-short-patch-repair endonuclease